MGLPFGSHYGPSPAIAADLNDPSSSTTNLTRQSRHFASEDMSSPPLTMHSSTSSSHSSVSLLSLSARTIDFGDSSSDDVLDDVLMLGINDGVAGNRTKLHELEEFDEENDAKLFWDMVNSISEWQQHKRRQALSKKHNSLSR